MKPKSPVRKALEDAISAHEEDNAYELALGRLTIAWATAEHELYRVLLNYSGVSDAVGRAIFSGIRASVMIDYIRSIAHNTEMDEYRLNDLEFIFSQIRSINKMRDRLVHFSTDSYSYPPSNPKQRVLTNQVRVSRYGKEFVHIVDKKIIENMVYDLHGISNHLNQHWGPRNGIFHQWEENPGELTIWLYKFPEQEE